MMTELQVPTIYRECGDFVKLVARMSRPGDTTAPRTEGESSGCSDSNVQALCGLVNKGRELAMAIQELSDEQSSPRAEALRKTADQKYGRAGEIEIDDGAVVSFSDDGAYVAAWVWVDTATLPPVAKVAPTPEQ
jgi:hypothetical protein